MKRIEILLTLVFSATAVLAQPTSELIYEIKPNEKVIHMNEHRLSLETGKKGFILFVERYENGDTNQYMIRNDVESGPYDEIYDPEISWNYSETGFYWFVFYKDTKHYMNMNGTVYGPYDGIGPAGGWYHPIIDESGQFLFTFLREEQWSYNINGQEYGPYDEIQDYYDSENNLGKDGKFIIRYINEAKHYFNVSGQIFGPFDEFEHYYDSQIDDFDDGHYVLKVRKDALSYVLADGKQYGPFSGVNSIDSDAKGGICFTYSVEDGSYFYNLNGKVFGSFEMISSISLDPVFSTVYTNGGQWFINIAGKLSGHV